MGSRLFALLLCLTLGIASSASLRADEFFEPAFTDADQLCGHLDFTCEGKALKGHWNYPGSVEVAVINDGAEAFAARVDLIKKARRSIWIQALAFIADESGRTLGELLKKKAAEGVDVRILVDGPSTLPYGGLATFQYYKELRRAGVRVSVYWFHDWFKPSQPDHLSMRFHEKIFLVDATEEDGIGILGGINTSNAYFAFGHTPSTRWRDQDILVRGRAVLHDLRQIVGSNWRFVHGLKQKMKWDADHIDDHYLSKAVKQSESSKTARFRAHPEVMDRIRSALNTKREQASFFRASDAWLIHSYPRLGETGIYDAYLHLIDSAKSEVLIANAYFIPTREMQEHLIAAARRGVRVKLITNSMVTNDLPVISQVSRTFYARLLHVNQEPETRRNGGFVKIMEWDGPKYGMGTLHEKFGVIDGRVSIIGSYNLDSISRYSNSEVVLAYDSVEAAARLMALFHQDEKMSRIITLREAKRFAEHPNVVRRVGTEIATWFKRWL